MFVARESKKHLDAKNALCEMFNTLGNEGYMALVEVPLMKYKEFYDNFTWTNTWTGMPWRKQSDVPDFKTCKERYGEYRYGPFKMVDVAVYQHGRLKYLIEICATNPVRPDQIQRIKQEGLVLYEVQADDVLAMAVRDRKTLGGIVKKLC